MKKIGEGWQYTVYDLENGRVLKTYNHPLRSLWIILKDVVPGELCALFKVHRYIPSLRQAALRSFEILGKKPLPSAWIGNPIFVNDLDYEQDHVTPVHEIINRGSCAQGKQIVDQFITFNQQLLKMGVIDKFFNMMRNFGINDTGEMILTDIGELIADEADITKQRRQRRWAAPYKLIWIQNEEVRTYFIQEMDKHITLP